MDKCRYDKIFDDWTSRVAKYWPLRKRKEFCSCTTISTLFLRHKSLIMIFNCKVKGCGKLVFQIQIRKEGKSIHSKVDYNVKQQDAFYIDEKLYLVKQVALSWTRVDNGGFYAILKYFTRHEPTIVNFCGSKHAYFLQQRIRTIHYYSLQRGQHNVNMQISSN